MKYELPSLPYGYADLEPHISEEQLRIHHQKHHQTYVDGANSILGKLEEARKTDTNIDMKATLKSLAFNIGGHKLHSLFWDNLSPNSKNPEGRLLEKLEESFGSLSRFKREFFDAALTVEGSGWATLSIDSESKKLMINQIEKHGNNVYTSFPLLMVIDMFEHAYYIDRKNDKAKFLDSCWYLIDWEVVEKRLTSFFR